MAAKMEISTKIINWTNDHGGVAPRAWPINAACYETLLGEMEESLPSRHFSHKHFRICGIPVYLENVMGEKPEEPPDPHRNIVREVLKSPAYQAHAEGIAKRIMRGELKREEDLVPGVLTGPGHAALARIQARHALDIMIWKAEHPATLEEDAKNG